MAVLDFNFRPSRRDLRLFFGVWLPLFLVVVGGLAAWRHGAVTTAAVILLTIAAISTLLGWIRPQALWIVYLLWLALAFPIGWVVSHLILGFVYFIVLTPVGLVMRAFGYDPMVRRYDRSATTYWVRREPQTDVQRYFRPV